MGARIQIRRGSATFWEDENPILFPGEPGYEKNTRRMKIGDGVLPWKELPYFTAPGASNTGGGGGPGGPGGGGLPLDPEDPDLVSFYNNGKV
jgi:hypothetical protein